MMRTARQLPWRLAPVATAGVRSTLQRVDPTRIARKSQVLPFDKTLHQSSPNAQLWTIARHAEHLPDLNHNLGLIRTGEWYHRRMTTATAQVAPNLAFTT
jgi:hypothetical protein